MTLCFAVPRVFCQVYFSSAPEFLRLPLMPDFQIVYPKRSATLEILLIHLLLYWSAYLPLFLLGTKSTFLRSMPPVIFFRGSASQIRPYKKNKVFWGYIYIIEIKSALRLSINTTAVQQYIDDREKVPGSNWAAVTKGRKHGCNYFYRHVFLCVQQSSPPPKSVKVSSLKCVRMGIK